MATSLYYLTSSSIYLLIILAIGIWSRKKVQNFEPHLGGRSMGFWATALSAHASDMSAWLFLSLPMLVWMKGAEPVWIAIGLWVGMGLNWLVVAKRLRDKTAQANCVTLPAWLHKAFNDQQGWLRLLCACSSTLFLLHYLAAGLIAMGLLTNMLFGIDYSIGTFLTVFVITAYTIKGGFNAVATVDLFQALFLLAAIVLVPTIGWFHVQNYSAITQAAAEKQISLSFWLMHQDSMVQAIITALGWGLGYFGMPHILSKFMGIRSSSELKKSMVVGLVWQAIALGASLCVGLVGLGMVQLDVSNPEMLFVRMVEQLFHPACAGFIFCAIMAANLSTMDSQLLVTASVIVQDILKPYKKIKKKHEVLVFQLTTLLLAMLAWFISCSRSPSVQEAVMYSWSGLGAAYGPLILWSLYAKPSHWFSGCLSLTTACACVMAWPYFEPLMNAGLGTQYIWPPLLPGFLVGLISLFLSETYFRYIKRSLVKLN